MMREGLNAAFLDVGCAMLAPAAQRQQIALAFEDLPAHGVLPLGETQISVAARIIAALGDAGAPPSRGFLNGQTLAADPEGAAMLRMWRVSGNLPGNHTWSRLRFIHRQKEAKLMAGQGENPTASLQ